VPVLLSSKPQASQLNTLGNPTQESITETAPEPMAAPSQNISDCPVDQPSPMLYSKGKVTCPQSGSNTQ